jgi:ribulose 1,5-bisphosphate synthetase/thiazole synthase
MNNQIDTVQEVGLSIEALRDLLESEVILVGGGEASLTVY